MNKNLKTWLPVFDTNGGPELWIPEVWAAEALMQLEPNMGAAAVVYKDYSNDIAQFGDTINITTPGTFTVRRKSDGDAVSRQAATARRVQVSLNQHLHTSFFIYDGEESKGWPSLREKYLIPAVRSIAQGLDQIVLSQVYQFLPNMVGKVGSTPGRQTVVAARTKMNDLLAPVAGRTLFVTPDFEGALLDSDQFSHAEKSGSTEALREGSIGRAWGWDIFMGQNTPNVTEAGDVQSDTLAASASPGATSVTVTAGLNSPAGAWMLIAGDMQPHRILTYDPYTNVATFEIALNHGVASGAAVTVFEIGAINQSTDLNGLVTDGYPNGWVKDIDVDGFSTVPGAGRLVTFGNAPAAARFGLMTPSGQNKLMLDRPLEGAVADDGIIGAGPTGQYCFGFVPNAMALVMRPLALPIAQGALSWVATNADGTMGIRVTITYDGNMQGHLVTVDMLAGIKVLDQRLGLAVIA